MKKPSTGTKSKTVHGKTINGCALTDKGIEETTQQEALEILKAKASIHDSFITFPLKKKEDLLAFAYRTQAAHRVLLHLGTFTAHPDMEKTIAACSAAIPKDLSTFIPKSASFRVDCERHGTHDFTSMDFAAGAGEAVMKAIGKRDVSMRSPDAIITVFLTTNEGMIGLDITGKNLGKRHYKIFLQPNTIKGTLAYALVRESGFVPGETLLDPFAGVGTIPIEAALYATRTSSQAYTKEFTYGKLFKEDVGKIITRVDKERKPTKASRIIGADRELRLVKAGQKNAKIAGVEKAVELTRVDVEWLDTRFAEGEVDRIATQPPAESKMTDKKEIEATMNELFHQAAFILKKRGTLAILTPSPATVLAHAKGFTCTKKKTVYSGEQAYAILVFTKEVTT